MNTHYLPVLRVVVSGALLTLAWYLVDDEKLLVLLRTMDLTLLFIAVLFTVPMHLLSAMRWKLTSTRIGAPLPFSEAVREYYLASWLNTVLPGGVSGDAMRVWRQGASNPSKHERLVRPTTGLLSRFQRPLHGVVLERFAGQCALFAILGVGITINYSRLTPLLSELFMLCGLIALVIVACWALASRVGKRSGSPPGWRKRLRELRDDAKQAFSPWPVFWHQLALSLAVVTTYLAIFWLAALAVHVPLDLATAILAIPLVLTAMTLPVSVGGLGLRESAAAVVWPGLAMSANSGVASALAYGAVILIGALPGAIVLMHRRSASQA